MKLFRRKRLKPSDLARFNQRIYVDNWMAPEPVGGRVIFWSWIIFLIYIGAMGYVGTYTP